MAEDTIIVKLDDSQLEDVLVRIELLGITGQKVTGKSGDLGQTLPSINRELRLILGQIPGVRILMADYFRVLRIQRSMLIAAKDLKKAGEEITLRSILLQPTMILTILATLTLLAKMILTYQQEMKREEKRYERLIRSYKDLTHTEFLTMRKEEKAASRRGP